MNVDKGLIFGIGIGIAATVAFLYWREQRILKQQAPVAPQK